MKKTLVAMSLLAPMAAHSLGVGEIKLHSSLNQKLDAEIALSLAADETISDIKVALASPSKFDEAGIAWSYFVSTVKLKPILKKNGHVIIKLTSKEVVQEPFLDFLVEVSWPKGDIFKEFTVLLDPPVVYQSPKINTVTAVQAKVSSRHQKHSVDAPVDYSSLAVDGQYGPTKRNDSLWKVAKRVNKHADVSVEQMMMALYSANPNAFYKKNVNALMEGKALNIPRKSEIVSLSKRQANARFYRQMAVWEGKAVAEPDMQVASHQKINNQLTLAPPTEGLIAQSDNLTASTDVSQELNVENQQLQERLANLEEQFSIMREMLAIKDQQLSALQNKEVGSIAPVESRNLLGGEGLELKKPEREVPDPLLDSDLKPIETIDTKPVPELENEEHVLEGGRKPAPVQHPIQAIQASESLQEQQKSSINYTYIGWGAFGLLALTGLGFLLWRKRQVEEELNENSMFAASSEIILPEEEDEGMAAPVFDEIPSYDVGTVGESSFLSEFTPSDFGVFETDQAEIDPTAETDVYLAYGRYQQAEDLMRQAITDHPDKDDYKLKLLEIFYASENEEGFELFANTLISEGKNTDLNFWSKVSEMGSEIIPNSPLFSSEYRESKFESTDVVTEPSSDEGMADVMVDAVEEVPAVVDLAIGDEANNSDIDFDLSSFALMDDSDGEPAGEGKLEEAGALDDLDFDLSSFESVGEDGGSDKADTGIPEELGSFDFDFDTDNKSDAGISEGIDAQQLNVDPNNDISLDEFDFSTAADDEVTQNELESSVDTQAISEISSESEHSSFDFDFEFDEVPEKKALGSGVESFDQDDLNKGVSDLTNMDEFETKIDLAKAYIDMGDIDAAKDIAQEVVEKGNEAQKKEALAIIGTLG